MDQQMERKRVREQASELLRTRRDTPEVQALRRLLEAMLEDVMNKFLSADITAFQGLQGEAKAIRDLVRVLNTPTFDELRTRGAIS